MKKIIKCCKENDCIKIAVILSALILIMLAEIVKVCVSYYKYLSQPLEITCSFADFDSASEKIKQSDEIISFTKTITKDVMVGDQMLRVECINADYLNRCYGVKSDSNNTIWLNNKAVEFLFSDKAYDKKLNEAEFDGKKKQMIFTPLNTLPDDEPYAVILCGESKLKQSEKIRICMKKDGTLSEKECLNKLNLYPINGDVIVKSEYEQKILISKIKYLLLIIIVSLLGVFSNVKIYRMKMIYKNLFSRQNLI